MSRNLDPRHKQCRSSDLPITSHQLPLFGALALVVAFGVVGCGSSDGTGASSGVTCDEYSQKELAPANIGGESQSSDIIDLLAAHDMPVSIQLTNQVQSAVNEFCGKPSPYGDKEAQRNNSRTISDAIDWDQLSQN